MKNARQPIDGLGRTVSMVNTGNFDVERRRTIRLDGYVLDDSENDRLVIAGRMTGFDDKSSSEIILFGEFQVTEILQGTHVQAPKLIVPRNRDTVGITDDFEDTTGDLFLGFKITGAWEWTRIL